MQHLHCSLPLVSLKQTHLEGSRVMLLLVMVTLLMTATQSPLRVETTAFVKALTEVVLVEAHVAKGVPFSQTAGAILSLKSLTEAQHWQGFATVFERWHPHC